MPRSYCFPCEIYKMVLYRKLCNDVWEILSVLCKYKDIEIIAETESLGHVHLSVAILPKLSVSKIM